PREVLPSPQLRFPPVETTPLTDGTEEIMKIRRNAGIAPVMFAIALSAPAALAAPLDSTTVVERSEYGLVVSGTRTLKNSLEIPASVDVVRGDVLRRRGVRTLAEALQDVTG